MADNIIESLEIQFKASTKSADSAVKKLIANLGEVNVALRNVQDNSKYASSVDVVTESFNRLGESLSGLNIGGLSELSKALKALGNLSAPKVDMSNVTRQTTQASEAVQNLSREFAEGIGADDAFDLTNVETVIQRMVELYRSGAQEVQIAVDGMLGAGGDFDADLPFADVGESISDMSSPVNEASEELESLRNELRLTAQDAISANGEIDGFSKSLLEYIRTAGRIKIPESAIQESGDNFKSDRGVAGLSSFVTKAEGVPFDAGFLEEMDAALGTQYHLIENAAGAWTKFIADVRAARDAEENMQRQLDSSSMKEAEQVTNAFVESIRKLADSGDSVVPVIQSIASSTQQMSTGTDGIRSIGESLQAIAGIELPDAANLSALGLAVGKFGLKSATQAAFNMPTIAQGLSAMSGMNVTLPDPTMLSNFATSLRSFGYESMTNALVNMRNIPNAVSGLSAVQSIPEVTGLDELARSVARFGYSSATRAIEQMPQLGAALNNLLTSLSQAPAVNTQTAQLINSLAQLSTRSISAGNAIGRTTRSLNLFGNTASKASKKTFTLASAIGKVYATYWLLFRAFGKLKDAIDISSSLTEVQNVVATTFGELTDRAEEFAKTSLETFGLSELSAKQYASRFQAMGSAMGISSAQINKASDALAKLNTVMDDRGYTAVADSIADVSINITKLAADIASFYNVEQSDAAEDLQAIFTGQTRPLRKYGLDLTQATLKEWALANGLDANIKSMSQAEKTMLRYQYVMAHTQKVQGDFAKTMLTWHNQITILKENLRRFGRVVGDGLIAALRPVVVNINNMMNGIITAVQNVVNALGKIFGWQMIVDQTGSGLVDDTEEYADSLEDAAGNAKKLKSMLLGIDELNVLSDKDDGSGSGASSGLAGLSGGMDGSVGGIEFVDYESDLNNLFALGRKINEKLKKMMEEIDWNSIFEKAKGFGTGLADFLNGLITPDLFSNLGRTIANTLNTIVTAAFNFATTFDWENLGESVGEGVNSFFDAFEWKKFGKTIDAFVQGIWKAFKKAVKTIKWGEIFEDIDSIDLDLPTISIIIGALSFKFMGKLLTSTILRQAVANKLVDMIGTSGASGAGKAGVVGGLGKVATIALKVALTLVVAKISFEFGKDLGKQLDPEAEDFYDNFHWFGEGGFFDTVLPANPFKDINGFIEDIKIDINAFKMMLEDFGDNDAVTVGISGILGPISAIPLTIDNVKDSFEKAFGENGTIPNVLFDFGTKVDDEFGEGGEVPRTIGGFISYVKEKYGGIVPFMATVWQNINERFSKPFEAVFGENGVLPTAIGKFKSKVEEDFGGIPGFLKYVWGVIQKSFFDEFIKKIDELKDKSTKTFGDIKEKIGNVIDNIKTILSGLNAFIDGVFSSDWQSAWNGVKEVFKGVWNAIANILEGSVNAMIDGINFFTSDFRKIANGIADATGKEFHIGEMKHISIQKFATGGFPEDGFFFANHNELVGSFSNGQTAVANNEQIVAGIQRGVETAVSASLVPYLSQIAASTAATAQKDFSVNIGDRDIAKANSRGSRQLGMSIISTT